MPSIAHAELSNWTDHVEISGGTLPTARQVSEHVTTRRSEITTIDSAENTSGTDLSFQVSAGVFPYRSNVSHEQRTSLTHSAQSLDQTLSLFSRRYFSNYDAICYGELADLLFFMAKLPIEDESYIDPTIVDRAIDLIGVLDKSFGLSAPRVINEHGEALTLTWEKNGFKTYLSVGAEDLDVMHFHKASRISCEDDMMEGQRIAYQKVMQALAAYASVNSTLMD